MRNHKVQVPKQKFWPQFKKWAANLNFMATPDDHIRSVNIWFDTFLGSEDANELELRLEIMVMRDEILHLFTMMSEFAPEEREEILNKHLI